MRVAVPPEVLTMTPRTGHGRVWSHVLASLRERVELVELGSRRRLGRRSPPPDVFLCDGHRPLPDGAEMPLVVQVHEASWHDPAVAATLDPAFVEVLEREVSASVARADIVITGAHSARDELLCAYALEPERVVVVPHGVDLDVFAPGTPAQPPYVLFVGALHPRKNLGALREAMTALIAQGLPHRLVVVGPPAADRAPEQAQREAAALLAPLPGVAPDRLEHREARDDHELAALMAGAAALCLPSLHEGFGLPALEAMACGTPVLVSDRGSLPEVVGDAGLVAEPTAPALTAALRRLLTDDALAIDLRSRGRARAETMTWEHTADGWLAALRRAAPHAA